MAKSYKSNEIIGVLMRRDGMTRHEATCELQMAQRLVLDDAPTVDAIPVVRCKNCKYSDGGTDEDGKLFLKCLGWVYGGTREDDFCSHGERNERKDGDEHE